MNTVITDRMGWLAMALVSLSLFGNFYVYDSIAPIAEMLSSQLGYSDTQVGTLNAIYSIPNVVLVIVGGILVDRYGVGRVGTITAGICFLGALLTAASPNFYVMATGRLLYGIGAETYGIATYQPLKSEPLAKTGHSDKEMVSWECGLVVTAEKANAKIENLTP